MRFPEFSGEWEQYRLGNLVEIRSGVSPTGVIDDEGVFPFYKVEQLNNCYINLGTTPYMTNQSVIPANSIVFPKRGAAIMTNKIRISSKPCQIDTNLMALSIISSKEFDYKFIYYFIDLYNLSKIADTSTIPQINNIHINPLKIKIPSICEQKKISDFLSLLDDRIATQIKIIEKFESLIKGLCSSLFDKNKYDSFVRLGDISEITNGNSDVQDASLSYSDGMYPFFDRSEDIKFLPEYLLDKEAIIYPGEGSEFYPRYYNGKFALHQRCYAIYDIAPNFATRYLYFFCKTQNSYFVRNAVGSTVASLRLDTFKRLNIPNIPIELQKTYVQLLDKIETKIVDNKTVLKKYEEQKRYLLSNLFI